jgi:hypothetical protein
MSDRGLAGLIYLIGTIAVVVILFRAWADQRRYERRNPNPLWLIHEFDIGDLYETVEREKRDKKGRLVVDQNGKPVMVRYQQIRHAADIPPDVLARRRPDG